MYLIW